MQQPRAIFNSFLGVLDIKSGMFLLQGESSCGVKTDRRVYPAGAEIILLFGVRANAVYWQAVF
jgi:hypothetical protein